MKKTSQYLSALIITVLFYSCASVDRSAFTKRKYYDFKHPETELAFNKPVKRCNSSIIPEKEHSIYTNEIKQVRTSFPANKQTALVSNIRSKKTDAMRRTTPAKTESTDTHLIKQVDPIKERRSNETKGTSALDPINPAVLVILAIFIPPLAVYLKEESVTSNFWIDLLLCLLFWVPGVIFAILVVIDAI